MVNNSQNDRSLDGEPQHADGACAEPLRIIEESSGGKWTTIGVSTLVIALAFSMVMVLKGFLGGTPSASHADTGELNKPSVDWSRFEGGAGGQGNHVAAAQMADTAEVEQAIRDSEALRVQGDFVRAEAVLVEAAEKFPFDKSIRLTQAQAYIGQQKWKEAYAAYQSAIAIVQSNKAGANSTVQPAPSAASEQAKQPVTKEEAELHFQAGTLASKAGLVERAVEHYTMAQAGDAAEPKYPLYLAMVQLKLGQDTPAMASLIRATKLNPDLAEAWGTLAEIELRNNHLGLAAQHLEKARKLQPEVARWRIVEARLLNRQGNAEQAATLLLALDPATRQTPGVLGLLAESYGLLNKPAEAAAAYSDAARAKVDDASLAYQAALWNQRAGNLEEAKRFARAADAMGYEGANELVKTLEQ